MSKFVACIPKDAFTEKQLWNNINHNVIPDDALSWAAENGYTEIVNSLIKLGAQVTENRNYPLELASRNGHTEIVKSLIAAGAKTSDSAESEGYCLRMAADGGHTEIVQSLLQANADPTADNYSALRFALNRNRSEIVELLLDYILAKREKTVPIQ